MAGSCLPTWSRVCGSALQCISCQPKDVISWNLDEPDSSVWDIMPWKASKLPQIEKGKKQTQDSPTRAFPCIPRCPCGRQVKIVLAESPNCTHSPSPDMRKSFQVLVGDRLISLAKHQWHKDSSECTVSSLKTNFWWGCRMWQYVQSVYRF